MCAWQSPQSNPFYKFDVLPCGGGNLPVPISENCDNFIGETD